MNNTISKNVILTYAKALRTIQKEQIDPYVNLIEKELIKVYPELEDREDNALNWAYDILNAESNSDVVDTLTRLDKIITNERQEQWVCEYCGKNTFNDDIEYLFGKNHIGCTLNEDIKKREHSDPDYTISPIKASIDRLEKQMKSLEKEITALKTEVRH